LLPSKTEIALAAKCKFDLYTVTNLSVADLAAHLSIPNDLFAVAKAELSNKSEDLEEFASSPFLTFLPSKTSTVVDYWDEPNAIARRRVDLQYNEVIDVTHSRDCIY